MDSGYTEEPTKEELEARAESMRATMMKEYLMSTMSEMKVYVVVEDDPEYHFASPVMGVYLTEELAKANTNMFEHIEVMKVITE